MNDYEFDNQLFPVMTANWPDKTAKLNSEQVLIWRNALRRFPSGEAIVAVRTHAEKSKFFPAPCEIAKICQGNSPTDRGAPRNRVDHDALEALRHEIAQEVAEDAVTLANVSDDEFDQHLKECVRINPTLSHLTGRKRSDRMAQTFVCDMIGSPL